MGTVRDDTHTVAPPGDCPAGPGPVRLPGQPHGAGHVSIRELCLHEREGACAGGFKLFCEQSALPIGERAQHLGLADVVSRKELPAPCGAPTTLAHQQLPNRPRERLVGRVQDDFRGGSFSLSDPSLQLRTGQPDRVRSFQRSQSLRRRAHCGGLRHLVLCFLPFLRLGGSCFFCERAGVNWGPLPWVLYCALLFRTPKRSVLFTPVSGLPYPSGHLPCSAVSVGGEATPSAQITATSQVQAMRSERVFFVSERLVRVWTRRRRYSWFTFAGGA
jgi:hypothetical protein